MKKGIIILTSIIFIVSISVFTTVLNSDFLQKEIKNANVK